ncbi:putative ABC transporter, permease protein [Gordonia polyisoprenivorans VH2]|uniref:Putative ABC transporter, permease protein n=1 Tax=Gordonia polyisoprenivorans (strain DSM 44266 / VH2) TaxID=1112204 RepID=H6MV56_GORPV|nr:ABC transporter permease [Gordonia polyisoprenivorans]AFA71643.1 putative ABC transporter, permease protein [Gordonia polyisoprenivorans VH2]
MAASSVMRKVSLRNLRAHKLRLFLTVFSIVLGTSFVAGSIVFTSTISHAFNSIFEGAAQGVAVEITPQRSTSDGVPDSVVDQLRERKQELGIDKIVTNQQGPVTIAGADGKALQTGGAPSIATAYIPPDQAISSERLLPGGRAPNGQNEIVLNSSAADKGGLKVGSKTKLVIGQGSTQPLEVTVVGLVDLPTSTGGYVNVQFDQQTASDIFSDGSHVAVVDMSAVSGVSADELAKRVSALVDTDQFKVRTGDQVRADEKAQVNQFLTIFTGILLAFAAIGLIVGTFIIYNTFSMIVAQRNRELALLRAIGASRRQVSRSVLFEAFVVGVIGGLVGLGVGVGLAAVLKAVVGSASGLPSGSLQVGVWAVLAALFVGIVVTMVSAWVPAVRAARVSPVEAMRAGVTEGAAPLRNRTLVGVVFLLIAIGTIAWGAMGAGLLRAVVVGIGAGAAIVASVLAGPALSKPIVGGLGRVIGAPFGTVGRLARTNAVRNPRRSAATAFALTLGLMLVAVIGTLGASFKGTVDQAVDAGIRADYIVAGTNNSPVPESVAGAVTKVPGISDAVSFGIVSARIDGQARTGFAALGGDLNGVSVLNMLDGASSKLPADGMLISERTANERGWKRGQTLTFTSADGTQVPVTIAGVYQDNEALQPWMVGSQVYEKVMPETSRITFGLFVKAAPGTNLDTLRTDLENATSGYLTVQVETREQYKSSISEQIDQMLATLYAMLGLALLIAVLGIINTLALSVVERKREIGMLRAIGTLRSQIRRTIYLESVLIAIYGAVLGVVLGSVIGWALVRTLARWGLGDPVLPWSLMGWTLLASAVVGVLAALWPAVRAARTKPLEAIAEG